MSLRQMSFKVTQKVTNGLVKNEADLEKICKTYFQVEFCVNSSPIYKSKESSGFLKASAVIKD